MSKKQRDELDQYYRSSEMTGSTPDELRAGFAHIMAHFEIPEGIDSVETTVGGRPALRITRSAGEVPGTILYFHGGAFALGSPQTALAGTAELVLRTGITALSVDYRLAPEEPYPAAVDDVVNAYREILDGGTDPATIVLAGDSAGGWLAVVTALTAHESRLPMPAAIVTFSGLFDATLSGSSMTTKAAFDPVLTPELLGQVIPAFLAGSDPNQDLLSPAIRGDLSSLPPLLLQVGSNEILLDDSVRLAARAAAANVRVILDVTPDVPHVFQLASATVGEADEAVDRAAQFITRHLTAAVTP